VTALVATTVFASYGMRYAAVSYGPIEKSITSSAAREISAYIEEHTDPDDVILFGAPYVLLIYTTRHTTQVAENISREDFLHFAERVKAEYWLRPVNAPAPFRDVVKPIFGNEQFVLYRITQDS